MSDTQKRLYEISFLLQKEEDVTEVAQLLEEHGATVTDEGEVKKLAFAYPIDRISEGYFGYLHATIDPIKAKEIEIPHAVVAKKQTAGIGSRSNSWIGEDGNLFLSFAIKSVSVSFSLLFLNERVEKSARLSR